MPLGLWFSPGTPVYSANKTDHHDITEILLKVALNTITPFLWITGYSSSNRIDIQLLSQEDGRQGLVKMAQKLSKEVTAKNFKLEDITPQNVDSLLQGMYT